MWIVDSGATDHIARDRNGYVEYRRVPAGRKVYMGNDSSVDVLGIGTYKLEMRGCSALILYDVLYAPDIRHNLFSILSVVRLGYSINFENNFVIISHGTNVFGHGFMILDTIDSSCNSNDYYSFLVENDHDGSIQWHARLGHIGQDRMARLARAGLLGPLAKVNLPTCEHCLAGKSTRKPFGKATRAETPLQLIHSDICGPMNVKERHGRSYFLTMIDDYTRFGYTFLISHKSEALDCFRRYLIEVENQLDKSVKALRTDRGREYLSDQFKELCEEKGIIR